MTKRFYFLCRRGAALLALAITAAALLGGCGSSKLTTFTWEVDAVPSNLDPQTASSSQDIIAVTHLFSGLYRLDPEGQPQPDCAESCTVSPDGLTYTFTLKEGLDYSIYRDKKCSYTLSAADFVFGLQRVFMPSTSSPWVNSLSNIHNGLAIAAGQMDPAQLGVSAPDARTLVIQLDQPDENFLAKLCLPGAMPCQQEYFEASGGSYGLGVSSTMGNGPFYLYNWTESGLFLRRGGQGSLINNLRLVLKDGALSPEQEDANPTPTKTPLEKVQDSKTSAAWSETDSGGTLTELPFTTTTWALVYNCNVKGLSSTAVRQGLSASAAQTGLEFSGRYSPANGLLPPSLEVNGRNYRQNAGTLLFESSDPLTLFRSGLEELGLTKLSYISVLVPQGDAAGYFAPINQQWQKQLSAFFTVQELPLEQVEQAVAQGQFQIALIPLSPTHSDPLLFLQQMAQDAPGDWRDADFAAACSAEALNYTLAGRADRLAALEKQLLTACPLAPLYHETRYLLADPLVEGLVFEPFGPTLDVTAASR